MLCLPDAKGCGRDRLQQGHAGEAAGHHDPAWHDSLRCDNEGDFPSALGQDELEPPDSNPARHKSRFKGDSLRNDKIQNKHAVRKKRHFYEGRRK